MEENVTRRQFVTYSGMLLAGGLGLGACQTADSRRTRGPNVVLIMADDPIPENKYNEGTRTTYKAMVERMDEGVGAILDTLRDSGIDRNTLVIFMSDNGGTKIGRNEPFSGYKGNVFEGGIRVPCVVRWPGVLPGGVVSDQPCMTMDFSQSIVRAAGATPSCSFDGIDILRLVETGAPAQSRTLFWRIRRGQWTRKAVRDGAMKYIALTNGNSTQEHLFDLVADPGEKNNLLSERADVTGRMKRLLAEWEDRVRSVR